MKTIYTTERPLERGPSDHATPRLLNRTTQHDHRARLELLVLAWLLALFCPLAAWAQSYTATFVAPDPDFPVHNLAKVNDAGEIVGHYFPDWGMAHPMVWRNGVFTALPILPGTSGGVAMANNNAGQIVGSCFDAAGNYQACIWEFGTVRALPALPDMIQTQANDINDAGDAVGSGWVPVSSPDGSVTYRQDTVVWQNGTVQAIKPPSPEVQTMNPQAIDAFGRVAVTVNDESTGSWIPGRWTPDVPNGVTGAVQLLDWSGSAYDINDSGVVCGGDNAGRAAFWDDAGPTVIGQLPGGYWAEARSINGNGIVVGYSVSYDYLTEVTRDTAFVWTAEHGMRDLNALMYDNVGGEWTLANALSINNVGQILAMSDNTYVLLNPSPLPPPLPAPNGLSSQAGDNVVALFWNPVTIATAYNVKRSLTSGGPYTTIAAGVSGTSYSDRTAVNGVRYYYVVTAVDETRESAISSETSAKPLATPLAPTNLAAKVAKAKVTLTWQQSTSPEIQRNRVYRSTNGGAYVLIANITPSLTWTDYSVSSKTPYRYVVTAVNSIGLESPASNAVSARPK